ncbi:TGACG-sequence-specific DNA-binding protein TGA-2-1 [Nymphaea thermarum]|nr:TGACG-sequence-specific DNA-binding protein TGA-2-1 [Nymphaea thermarum]
MSGFKAFFNQWIQEQGLQLQELKAAESDPEAQHQLASLILRVTHHYENYYKAKADATKEDVLRMYSPSWTSTLENSLMWIAGWRPSTIFHLIYTKVAGIQPEQELDDFLDEKGNEEKLTSLSPAQLIQLDELQRRTIREEVSLSEKMAKLQEKKGDQPFVNLAEIETTTNTVSECNNHDAGRCTYAEIGMHEEGLMWLLEKADELRLRTLKGVVDIMSPFQSLRFLTVAASLHLRVHEIGEEKDQQRQSSTTNDGQGDRGSDEM